MYGLIGSWSGGKVQLRKSISITWFQYSDVLPSIRHQEMCVSPCGWTERGRGCLTPVPRPSASLPVTHPPFPLAQWWSETYHRRLDQLLKGPRGLWGEGGSHDKEAGAPATRWAASTLMFNGWQRRWPDGPFILFAYSLPTVPFSLQTPGILAASSMLPPTEILNFFKNACGNCTYREKMQFLFFSCLNFYWSRVDLQCCVSFCCTAKWISYTYTCIHSFLFRFFSHRGYYRVLSRVPCAIQQVLISYLSYI